VNILACAYIPQAITITVGSTVDWTNSDPFTHTVTSLLPMFDSGDMGPGQHFQFMFPNAGTFDYHCTIHLFMTGTVDVLVGDLPRK
jgi:plastocyanin